MSSLAVHVSLMNAFKTADFVRDEFADVMIYLTRSASILGVDLMKEAIAKIDRNELRFLPVK
jgi:hypothetical protein